MKEKVLFNKMGKGHHLYGGGFGSSRVKYGGYGSHEPNLIWELSVPNYFFICYLFCFNICFLFWFALCFVWFFSPFVDVPKLFFFLCKYNQIDKHLIDKAMLRIISDELKNGHLLRYEESFNKDKATFEKTKVISHSLLFIWLSTFASLFVFL